MTDLKENSILKDTAGHTAVKIMKIRLNMIDVRMDYKGK